MDLLEGEHRIEVKDGKDIFMTSREWAAYKLADVAQSCEHGGYPQYVTAFDLGRALTNCNEEDSHGELKRGLERYLSLKDPTP